MVNKITEASEKIYMTNQEKRLKRRLIRLLMDDGKGHKHGKYAKRLEDFIIHIVSRHEDPTMTCAISWEKATIYISEGFLTDPDTFFQLNVLMRHELAHNLMCHQIRMMKVLTDKYGPKGATRIKMSQSLHELINIIEDFEISNQRYTEEDKTIVRNLMLNGRIISGLVTEDSRKKWVDLSVEQMFIELINEIDQIQRSILARWDALDMDQIGTPRDFIHSNIKYNLYLYRETDRPTNFFQTLEKFIADRGLYHVVWMDQYDENGALVRPCIAKWSSFFMPDGSESPYQEIIKIISDEFTETNGYVKQNLRDRVLEIAKTNPTVPCDILDSNGKTIETLYSPEEKLVAIDAFKARIPELEEYNTWYGKIQKTLSDPKYSDADLDAILAEIDK